MRLAPEDPRILLALWDVYTAQDAHDKALAAANAVPAASPAARAARFAVAQSLIALKRFDGAFQELNALHAKASAAAVSNALGVVQLRRGLTTGPTGAATYFARAVAEEPDNTTYLFNLGYAHSLAANAPEALSWLREAVRFDAADGDAHLVMSAVLASTGRAAEAQREFDLARSLGTSLDSTATAPASRVPAGLERLEATLGASAVVRLTTVTPAQRDQKETAAFHLARGRALFAERKDREAIEELRRAIYLAPYEDEPHLLLGRLYQRSGRTAEAIDEFKVALWSRETAAAQVALGAALLDAGEKEAARRAVERALVLSPGSVEARELLKRLGG
jgi:tetratricopeptide (TPR) repeat protein